MDKKTEDIMEIIKNIPDIQDTREKLIINELPFPHILTSLKCCPSCGMGRLNILETIKGSFLFCPSCNNVIYEIEIKKRYYTPSDFKIYERQLKEVNRQSEESSRMLDEMNYLKKLQVIVNLKEKLQGIN